MGWDLRFHINLQYKFLLNLRNKIRMKFHWKLGPGKSIIENVIIEIVTKHVIKPLLLRTAQAKVVSLLLKNFKFKL